MADSHRHEFSGAAGSLPAPARLRSPGRCGTRTSTASLQTVDHPPFTSVSRSDQVVEIRDETGSLIFAGHGRFV